MSITLEDTVQLPRLKTRAASRKRGKKAKKVLPRSRMAPFRAKTEGARGC